MAVSNKELKMFADDYRSNTGKAVARFVCPITLLDDPQAELCAGHILNKGIHDASNCTVVQRKDVDNYYGSHLEPNLIRWLNLPVTPTQELISATKNLVISGPNGEKIKTFRANSAARERFQQIDLLKPDGSVLESFFLRDVRLESKVHSQVEVEWAIHVVPSAISGSLLKSAYLAMFKMLGYRWVLNAAGDKVRRALLAFYEARPDKRKSKTIFEEFRNCHSILFSREHTTLPDTLEGGALLFHFADGDVRNGLMFGVTCLFKINGKIITVTLPAYSREGYYSVAYEFYQKFLRDRSMSHNIHFAIFTDGIFKVSEAPMLLHLTNSLRTQDDAVVISPPPR